LQLACRGFDPHRLGGLDVFLEGDLVLERRGLFPGTRVAHFDWVAVQIRAAAAATTTTVGQ
jgi:hypothetical protein